MIWNNTMNISQKTISRLFKTLGKLSYRQVNTLSDDINQQSFVDKVKHLTKGDRLCIIGQLNSYSNPNGYWRSSVTAEIVSPLTGLSTVDTDDDVIQAEKVEEDEEILTDEMNDKFDTEK
ncbi:unnamed protein product [Schistosoma margrebowiei]|uniref:Uncharacterized protein n=1 Tax=Schistosoma margrebowiei TaxID=48269 RepID=A0A183MAI9_9TREM|nr:unnamed protein product [Schistosoma margrebowiei]